MALFSVGLRIPVISICIWDLKITRCFVYRLDNKHFYLFEKKLICYDYRLEKKHICLSIRQEVQKYKSVDIKFSAHNAFLEYATQEPQAAYLFEMFHTCLMVREETHMICNPINKDILCLFSTKQAHGILSVRLAHDMFIF